MLLEVGGWSGVERGKGERGMVSREGWMGKGWAEKGEWGKGEWGKGERGKGEWGKGEWGRRFSKQKYSISFTTKAPAALPQPTKERSNTILQSPYLELRSSLLEEQSVWDGIIFQNNTVSSVLKTCSLINPFTSTCFMSCSWECVWERGFESEC